MLKVPAYHPAVVLALGFLMAPPERPLLEAQPPTAELSGTVSDAGHAPIAGVTVELISRKLHLEQTTGQDGSFHFCCLPPGTFDITFRHNQVPRPGAFALELSLPKRVPGERGTAGRE